MEKYCNAGSSQPDNNISTTMDDNFADYRKFCANRMRRLERYKKAKSFCCLEEETSTAQAQAQASSLSSGCSSSVAGDVASICEQRATIDDANRTVTNPNAGRFDATNDSANSEQHSENPNTTQKFDLLREKMISLMENDVRLLQQLLALGDSIQELKCRNQLGSQMSLNSLEEEEEENAWPADKPKPFSSSLTAVTNLYVDDEPKENVQYFSRKNSVLRIPIPPRSSNRMCANKRFERTRPTLEKAFPSGSSSEENEGLTFSNRDDIGSYEPRRLSEMARLPRTLHIEDHHHHSDPSCSEPNSAMQSPAAYGTTVARLSNGSIDSGIRDESPSSPSSGSPSPTFAQAKLD